MIVLDVRDLKPRNSAPQGWLLMHEEAASVMMKRFHDKPPTEGAWDKRDNNAAPLEQLVVEIQWNEPTHALLLASGNGLKNIERGAECIAIALANCLGFNVVGEVFHGSGADLLMIPRGEPDNDFYKLEVSGMGKAGEESPESRLREKVAQASRGQLNRPGMAIVVRFADMRILTEGWR